MGLQLINYLLHVPYTYETMGLQLNKLIIYHMLLTTTFSSQGTLVSEYLRLIVWTGS